MKKDIAKAVALDILSTVITMNPERHITLTNGKWGIKITIFYDVYEDVREDDLKWLNDSYGFMGEAKEDFWTLDDGTDYYTITITLD